MTSSRTPRPLNNSDTIAAPAIIAADHGQALVIGSTTVVRKRQSSIAVSAAMLLEYRLAPYAEGWPVHQHDGIQETWYVLDGTLAIMLGDHTLMVGRGTVVEVPAGVAHTFFNPTATPTMLLAWCVSTDCEAHWQAIQALAAPQRPNQG